MTTSKTVRRFLTLLLSTLALGCGPDDATWRARLADPDPNIRRAAIHDLASTVEVKTAMPMLTAALQDADEKVQVAAALALLRADPGNLDCRTIVERALNDGQGPVFIVLGATGEKAEWAVPTLITLLKDQKTVVRALAAKTLGEIGVASAEVVQALQQSNTDESPIVRSAVQESLARLGQSANGRL